MNETEIEFRNRVAADIYTSILSRLFYEEPPEDFEIEDLAEQCAYLSTLLIVKIREFDKAQEEKDEDA